MQVRVNEELVLDAGTLERDGAEVVIKPPRTPMFEQLLAFLHSKPAVDAPGDLSPEMAGAAAVAVAVRWGSYFAVLVDRAKRAPGAVPPGASRIADLEMARINIEASAALAAWVELLRTGPDEHDALARKALTYLPMPKRKARPAGMEFAALALPAAREMLLKATSESRLRALRDSAASHASRIFANALVNTAWRNGPIEDVHAGATVHYPLDERRLTAGEGREVLAAATDRLATGMDVARELLADGGRSWPEQVLPYGLAEVLLVTPVGWTLTEVSREVRFKA